MKKFLLVKRNAVLLSILFLFLSGYLTSQRDIPPGGFDVRGWIGDAAYAHIFMRLYIREKKILNSGLWYVAGFLLPLLSLFVFFGLAEKNKKGEKSVAIT